MYLIQLFKISCTLLETEAHCRILESILVFDLKSVPKYFLNPK